MRIPVHVSTIREVPVLSPDGERVPWWGGRWEMHIESSYEGRYIDVDFDEVYNHIVIVRHNPACPDRRDIRPFRHGVEFECERPRAVRCPLRSSLVYKLVDGCYEPDGTT